MRCPAQVSPLITLQRGGGGGGEIKDSRAVLGGRRRVEGQWDPSDIKAPPPYPTPLFLNTTGVSWDTHYLLLR